MLWFLFGVKVVCVLFVACFFFFFCFLLRVFLPELFVALVRHLFCFGRENPTTKPSNNHINTHKNS